MAFWKRVSENVNICHSDKIKRVHRLKVKPDLDVADFGPEWTRVEEGTDEAGQQSQLSHTGGRVVGTRPKQGVRLARAGLTVGHDCEVVTVYHQRDQRLQRRPEQTLLVTSRLYKVEREARLCLLNTNRVRRLVEEEVAVEECTYLNLKPN